MAAPASASASASLPATMGDKTIEICALCFRHSPQKGGRSTLYEAAAGQGSALQALNTLPLPFSNPSSSLGCPAQYVELLIKAKDESNARPNELEKQSKKAGIKGIAKRVTKDNHNCGNCRRAKEGEGAKRGSAIDRG